MEHKSKTKEKGFTLIEVLVVIAVLGLVTSLLLVSLKTALAKARDARRIAEVNEVKRAVDAYYENHESVYPAATPDSSLAYGWSNLLDILISDGLIGYNSEKENFADFNFVNLSLIEKAEAGIPRNPPAHISPQDPLYPKTGYSYGFMLSNDTPPKKYRIRAVLENTNNPVLLNSLTGDFQTAGDNKCNPVQGYYCVGEGDSGTFVPR